MRLLRKPHPLAMFFAWFLTVFIVLFPKGGIKIGPLPLTWGYMFFALTTPPLLVVRILSMPLRIPYRLLGAFAMLLPMQVLYGYAFIFYGVGDTSFAISSFSSLFLLPIIFLLIYPSFLKYVDGDRLSRYFRLCVLFAAIWGIFLFFWHPLTNRYIEIPYLTVNVADVGELENTKHIARGLFFKLISTYNNGNLYGVCMLITLPLYNLIEPRRWRRLLLKGALLLTLSRTIWAGLIVEELLSLAVVFYGQFGTFPRLYLGKASRRVLAVAITFGLICASLLFNSFHLDFLFDPKLGGRSPAFSLFLTATFLPSQPLGGFQEVAYASAVFLFGYAGLAAFILLMLSPILLLFVDSSALQSPSRRAALKGLILYSFLAWVDGGFSYLPTMAFYWFAYMIYLFGWPAAHKSITGAHTAASPVALSLGNLAQSSHA